MRLKLKFKKEIIGIGIGIGAAYLFQLILLIVCHFLMSNFSLKSVYFIPSISIQALIAPLTTWLFWGILMVSWYKIWKKISTFLVIFFITFLVIIVFTAPFFYTFDKPFWVLDALLAFFIALIFDYGTHLL